MASQWLTRGGIAIAATDVVLLSTHIITHTQGNLGVATIRAPLARSSGKQVTQWNNAVLVTDVSAAAIVDDVAVHAAAAAVAVDVDHIGLAFISAFTLTA